MTGLTAAQENARTLAAALGLTEEEAAHHLSASLLITSDPNDSVAAHLAQLVRSLLSRTFKDVTVISGRLEPPKVEVVLGNCIPASDAPIVYASIQDGVLCVSRAGSLGACSPLHGSMLVIAACYISAAVTKAAVGGALPHVVDPLRVDFADLDLPPALFGEPVEIGEAYLAGAGAVGNGFLWALRYFDVGGKLHIVDPDTVSDGNLNRQIWFEEDDITFDKVDRLVTRAGGFFPKLHLEPRKADLKALPDKSDPRWLRRLIVGVDSRRTRRLLQKELPREVFDASTTGITEVVLHFNRQPSNKACMACIYKEAPDELAHEAHIAEALGVTVADVKKAWVDAATACKIVERYPQLSAAAVEGMAFDSLFKQLCGQQKITIEGQRVLAPFAFVSVLAGALLAIETAARIIDPTRHSRFNYWRVSPWHPFRVQQQRIREPATDCEVCGQRHCREVIEELWGKLDDGG